MQKLNNNIFKNFLYYSTVHTVQICLTKTMSFELKMSTEPESDLTRSMIVVIIVQFLSKSNYTIKKKVFFIYKHSCLPSKNFPDSLEFVTVRFRKGISIQDKELLEQAN